MGDELDIDDSQWPDYECFRPDTILEKPVDKQRLLQMMPEVIQKARKMQAQSRVEKRNGKRLGSKGI